MRTNASVPDFLNGLVFGFDVGTGSIGYAVRKRAEFKHVGVLICPEDTNDLSGRRGLRRQRRTLRSRKYRRAWFAKELEKLGLPKPKRADLERRDNETKEEYNHRTNPIALRNRALVEKLEGWQLHTALSHLFKRRGYAEVPWKHSTEGDESKEVKSELGEIRANMTKLGEEMKANSCKFPCEILAKRKKAGLAQRTEVWPRELLEDEFRGILKAQENQKLATKADWLLYGNTQIKERNGKTHHVFFNAVGSRNPGVLGLRWPRFDNRSPGLDLIDPENERGQPQHVARKKCKEYREAQWAMALINFRVQDPRTRKKFAPPAESLSKLREIWEAQQALNAKRKKKKAGGDADEESNLTISEAVLKKWADTFKDQFTLIEGQRALTPRSGAGRASFNRPNLIKLKERIERGEGLPSMQPLLRRDGETNNQALNRFLAEIKHPTVRHRLVLFRRLLNELIHGTEDKPGYGQPDMIVVEMARKLGMSENAKRKHKAWQDTNQEHNDAARIFWEEQDNHTPRKESIQRYRLWIEAGKRCPYCLGDILKPNDPLVEIEHVVPKSRAVCNEIYNLTLAHRKCNTYKAERTPYEAFHSNPTDWPVTWKEIEHRARACFARIFHFNYQHVQKIGGREVKKSKKDTAVNSKTKLDLFLSDNAVELLDSKSELVQSQYLAKLLRQVSLLTLDKQDDRWLSDDGRDPTDEKGNHPSRRFLVSNGQITSSLRRAWGLNQILNPFPPRDVWNGMSPEEQERKNEELAQKNRGDLRHHAVDAMVIACTLPWLAHRTHGAKDGFGNHGWWTQDEKLRSKAANPIFPGKGQMHEIVKQEIEKLVVQHHVTKSRKRKYFDTTRYGKRGPDLYIARKVLAKMNPKQLLKIYPESQALYLTEAWKRFTTEHPNVDALLKEENRGKDQNERVTLPLSFISRLCFSDYQRWTEKQNSLNPPEFRWPEKVQLPFKSVSVIADDGDNAMFETTLGSKTFVSQTEFKEVRVFLPPKGKRFIAQFVRPWVRRRLERSSVIPEGSKYVCTLRRGDLLLIKKPIMEKNIEAGTRWIVKKTSSDGRISILPNHLASDVNILKSLGIDPISFVRISLNELMPALGYELPHPPSAQPQSPGAVQA